MILTPPQDINTLLCTVLYLALHNVDGVKYQINAVLNRKHLLTKQEEGVNVIRYLPTKKAERDMRG